MTVRGKVSETRCKEVGTRGRDFKSTFQLSFRDSRHFLEVPP